MGGVAAFLLLSYFGPRNEVAALFTGAAGQRAQLNELSGRVGKLEAGAGNQNQLAARIDALEKQGASGQAGAGPEIADLRGRVEKLQQQVAGLQPSGSAAPPQDLTDRLDALEKQIETTRQLANQAATPQDGVDALKSRIEGQDAQIAATRERLDGLAGQVEQLGKRIDTTQSRLGSLTDLRERAATLALVSGQLEAALNAGHPYEDALKRLVALGGEDPAIKQATAKLEPMAGAGVPTLAELRGWFPAVADEVVHRARASEGGGFLGQAADNLRRLVTIRPVGPDVEGESPDARVARAEAKLAQGDLAAAIAEIEALQGPPADAAADWLRAARSRLAAQQALASVESRASDLLTQNP